jgi:hypothetical protein
LVLITRKCKASGGRLPSYMGMSDTMTESTLLAMADLLEVSESGSTSEDGFADDFVLVESEPKQLTHGRRMQPIPYTASNPATLVSFRKTPKTASGSVSNSGTTSPTHSQPRNILQYSSSPSQQTNMSASGYSPAKPNVFGRVFMDDYTSNESGGSLPSRQNQHDTDINEDSKSCGTPRNTSEHKFGSSEAASRSGSGIFSGSRSRVTDSPQSLSNSGVHVSQRSTFIFPNLVS